MSHSIAQEYLTRVIYCIEMIVLLKHKNQVSDMIRITFTPINFYNKLLDKAIHSFLCQTATEELQINKKAAFVSKEIPK